MWAGYEDIYDFEPRELHMLEAAQDAFDSLLGVDRAVDAFPDADKIADTNIETLKKLGHAGWAKLGLANGHGK